MENRKNKKVEIIIVSHNNKDILGKTLDSIRNQTYKNFTTSLWDNDSTDGTKKFILENYSEVKFKDVSAGPSEKRKLGIELSNSEYIVVMDSDARLTKNWIKTAVKYMDEHSDVGLCGGKILKQFTKEGGGNKEEIIDSAGGIVSKNAGAGDIGNNEFDKGQYETFKRVSFLKSATMIIRKKMTEQVNFDPPYFQGFEDADLGLRANLIGWKVVYNPDLVSYHLGHYTMNKKDNVSQGYYRAQRNRLYTFLKNFQLKTMIIYSPLFFIDFVRAVFKGNIKPIVGAYFWNTKHLSQIIKNRKEIKKIRKLDDKELFDLLKFPILIRYANKDGPYINFWKRLHSRRLNHLTFFITTRCNSKCKHCFYWKDLNKKDLSLNSIEKLLSKFYNLDSMCLSGGEPFMRQDLLKVIDLIIRYTNPKNISIPTNCLLGEKIISDLKEILKKHSKTNFGISCSLDGTESFHDYVRGVPGGFKKTIALIKKLNELKQRHPNFKFLSVNTVITKENSENLKELIELIKTLGVTDHFFDVIRGKHKGLMTSPSVRMMNSINKIRYNARKYYIAKKYKSPLKRFVANLRDKDIINTQMKALEGKKWRVKCLAGKTCAVIESDATMRICELTPKIGSLLENSPEELLKSKQAKNIFKRINNHECDCSHICYIRSYIP